MCTKVQNKSKYVQIRWSGPTRRVLISMIQRPRKAVNAPHPPIPSYFSADADEEPLNRPPSLGRRPSLGFF